MVGFQAEIDYQAEPQPVTQDDEKTPKRAEPGKSLILTSTSGHCSQTNPQARMDQELDSS